MKILKITCTFFLLVFILMSGKGQSLAKTDALLEMLKQQVESNFQRFSPNQHVYALNYRIEKQDHYLLSAREGSITNQYAMAQNLLTIQIRVGSTTIDNYYPQKDDNQNYTYSKVIELPLDDKEDIMADIIERETQIAYEEARLQYHKVLSSINPYEKKVAFSDYTLSIPNTYFEPAPKFYLFSSEEMKEKMRHCTSALNANPDVSCFADFRFEKDRNYLVSSEGTAIVENSVHSTWQVFVQTQTEDGTPVTIHKQYGAEYPDELPKEENVIRDIQDMEMAIVPMLKSESVQATLCPVVFAPAAASAFWHSALLPLVTGYDQPTDEQILPIELTISSDPTCQQYAETRLAASYRYDDEGSLGEPVVVVENGRWHDGLFDNESSRYFHRSNGHGRAVLGERIAPTPANVLVSTSRPYADEELRALLIKELKKTGLAFGYWVEFAIVGENNVIKPQIIKKVFADGRADEWAHGVEFIGTSRQFLSQVEALGKEVSCSVEKFRNVDYHCCTPAVLVRQVESRVSNEKKCSPAVTNFVIDGGEVDTSAHFSDVIFSAVDAALDSFNADNYEEPFFTGFLVTDAQEYSVKSQLGSLFFAKERPVRAVESQLLIGSNLMNSGWLEPEEKEPCCFPLDNHYNNIVKCLEKEVDVAYQRATRKMAEKIQVLQLLGDSISNTRPVERSSAWITNTMQYAEIETQVLSQLQFIANEWSLLFEPFNFLNQSHVQIDAIQGMAYYKATDGVQYAQPYALFRVRIWAEVRNVEGVLLSDYADFYYRNLLEIQEESLVQEYITKFVERLKKYQKAPIIKEFDYVGPVLMQGDAAAQAFEQAFVKSEPNIVLQTIPMTLLSITEISKMTEQSFDNKVDKKIIHRSLDIDAKNRMLQYAGKRLIGNYSIDADGIASEEKREIVHHGELVSPLTTRMTAGRVGESNGHLRLSLYDGRFVMRAGAGVLELSGYHRMDEQPMRKELCKIAKKAGNKYAYIFVKKIDNEHGKPFIMAEKINTNTGKCDLVCLQCAMNLKVEDFEVADVVSTKKSVYNTMVLWDKNDHKFEPSSLNGTASSFIIPQDILFNKLNLLKISR